jgi:hypothetical protein
VVIEGFTRRYTLFPRESAGWYLRDALSRKLELSSVMPDRVIEAKIGADACEWLVIQLPERRGT